MSSLLSALALNRPYIWFRILCFCVCVLTFIDTWRCIRRNQEFCDTHDTQHHFSRITFSIRHGLAPQISEHQVVAAGFNDLLCSYFSVSLARFSKELRSEADHRYGKFDHCRVVKVIIGVIFRRAWHTDQGLPSIQDYFLDFESTILSVIFTFLIN